MTKISAYLNLFDDWDILEPAIASFAGRVDEIIVVDGAYRWMLPYFNKIGRDPTRSLPPVYDILAKFGPKVKIVNGTWENEVEKRIAGYDACTGRYRYRTDADEIFFFDEDACAAFFASSQPVGQMSMPMYVAPGLISGNETELLPRQSFLFDSAQISAREHLCYLWLVLPDWERRTFGQAKPELIFPTPLAFNAHLTHWRPPTSSLSRARFYVMNYMRQHGAPEWAGSTPSQKVADFTSVFEHVPPADFDQIMLGRPLVVLPGAEHFHCHPTTLTPAQDQSFAPLYDKFLNGLAALNGQLSTEWRTIARGEDYFLDATRPDSLPLAEGNRLRILASEPMAAIRLTLSSYFRDPAQNSTATQQAGGGITTLDAVLPPLPEDGSLLRRVLTLTVWTASGGQLLKFKLQR